VTFLFFAGLTLRGFSLAGATSRSMLAGLITTLGARLSVFALRNFRESGDG
jgi:hypothetical protein